MNESAALSQTIRTQGADVIILVLVALIKAFLMNWVCIPTYQKYV